MHLTRSVVFALSVYCVCCCLLCVMCLFTTYITIFYCDMVHTLRSVALSLFLSWKEQQRRWDVDGATWMHRGRRRCWCRCRCSRVDGLKKVFTDGSKNIITYGFMSRISLWVNNDMRTSQTIFEPSMMQTITYSY